MHIADGCYRAVGVGIYVVEQAVQLRVQQS